MKKWLSFLCFVLAVCLSMTGCQSEGKKASVTGPESIGTRDSQAISAAKRVFNNSYYGELFSGDPNYEMLSNRNAVVETDGNGKYMVVLEFTASSALSGNKPISPKTQTAYVFFHMDGAGIEDYGYWDSVILDPLSVDDFKQEIGWKYSDDVSNNPQVSQKEDVASTPPSDLPEANPSDEESTYSTWAAAYEKVLTVMQYEFPNYQYICNYSMFDIDKDGYPELLLKVGTCEADFEYRFYNYDKNLKVAMCFGTTSGSHASICGLGDTQAILVVFGHQGYEAVRKAIYDGISYSEEVIFDGEGQEYHPFTFLAAYELNDFSGLQWKGNAQENNSTVIESISTEDDNSTFTSIEGQWYELDIESNGAPKSNGIFLDVSYDSLEYSVFDIYWGEEYENIYVADVTAFWGTEAASFSFLYDGLEATGTIYYRDGYIDLTVDSSAIPLIPVNGWIFSK